LIAAPGDRADQPTLRSERLAQRHDMGLQIILLSDAVGPHALHQRVFAYDRAARLEQRYQYIEGACAELERLAVGEQLAAPGSVRTPRSLMVRRGDPSKRL
jgi:hypothetical protein